MPGLPSTPIRPTSFASYSLVLSLALVRTAHGMLGVDKSDTGNQLVTVLSLIFMMMHSFAVNERNVQWKVRAQMAWTTLLWITSFHTSGSTMMTNKRNMLLETIAVLFLVLRDDV